MEQDFVIRNIDKALDGLRNSHKIWDAFYQMIDFDSFPPLDEIEGYFLDIAWNIIIEARDINEFDGEYEFFEDIMHEIANNRIFTFTDENNKEWEFRSGTEIWDYFKGDNTEKFFDNDEGHEE